MISSLQNIVYAIVTEFRVVSSFPRENHFSWRPLTTKAKNILAFEALIERSLDQKDFACNTLKLPIFSIGHWGTTTNKMKEIMIKGLDTCK